MYSKKLQPRSSVDESEVRDSISRCKSEQSYCIRTYRGGKMIKLQRKKRLTTNMRIRTNLAEN